MKTRVFAFFLVIFFTHLLVILNPCDATVSDIYCLKTLRESLTDPNAYLDSWDLSNDTEGSICKLNGIDCWHPDENKVLNIRLSDMGLRGQFPSGLENCTSLTELDLSYNELTGKLPSDISERIPFVTTLDLSYNNFSGEIPTSLVNCSFLNIIKLQHNQLTGPIPGQLTRLDRLNEFDVSYNLLSGQIPVFNKSKDPSYYANNLGLCGPPLKACKRSGKRETVIAGVVVDDTSIVVSAASFFFFFLLSFWIGICCRCSCLSTKSWLAASIN